RPSQLQIGDKGYAEVDGLSTDPITVRSTVLIIFPRYVDHQIDQTLRYDIEPARAALRCLLDGGAGNSFPGKHFGGALSRVTPQPKLLHDHASFLGKPILVDNRPE